MADFVAGNCFPFGGQMAEIKPTFRCLDCGTIYKEKKSFNDHICKDVNARAFACEICKKDFVRQDQLIRHRRIHTGERPYGCGCCSETFARTERLKRHMKKAHGVSKLACRPCSLIFEQWTDFQKHIAGHPSSSCNAGATSSGLDMKRDLPKEKSVDGRFPGQANLADHSAFGSSRMSCSYWCSVCGEGFITEHVLQEHLKGHLDQYNIQEKPGNLQPNFSFPMMNANENHTQVANDNMQAFDSAVCQSLARHVTSDADSGTLRCMRCYKLLPTYKNAENCQQMTEFCMCILVAEREQQRLFENTYNDTKWISAPEGKRRKRSVSTERRTCYECGELLSSPYALVRHVQTRHSNEQPYVCCVCDKAFARRDKLGHHFLKHPGMFHFTCTECGAMFPRWIECRQHARLHRLSFGSRGFQGSDAKQQNSERQRHANTCHICGAHFSRRYRLTEHLHKHTGIAPYVCKRCGRGFTRLDHKNSHEKLHNRENSLACGMCRVSFDTVEMLMQHRRIHVTPGPTDQAARSGGSFTCDTCSRQFKRKYALQRHQQSHTGVRPHLCPNCGLAFATSYGRKRHIENVHAGIVAQPIN